MSSSLRTPELIHTVSICFLDLRNDLLVGCTSELEEMYDRMDFDIQNDVQIKYWIFWISRNNLDWRKSVIIDTQWIEEYPKILLQARSGC
jgi:hypothetical protein